MISSVHFFGNVTAMLDGSSYLVPQLGSTSKVQMSDERLQFGTSYSSTTWQSASEHQTHCSVTLFEQPIS